MGGARQRRTAIVVVEQCLHGALGILIPAEFNQGIRLTECRQQIVGASRLRAPRRHQGSIETMQDQ